MPENHEKSEVISDRPTAIVNYRVACTRLKTKESIPQARAKGSPQEPRTRKARQESLLNMCCGKQSPRPKGPGPRGPSASQS